MGKNVCYQCTTRYHRASPRYTTGTQLESCCMGPNTAGVASDHSCSQEDKKTFYIENYRNTRPVESTWTY